MDGNGAKGNLAAGMREPTKIRIETLPVWNGANGSAVKVSTGRI